MAVPDDAPLWIHELLACLVEHGFFQVEEREHPEVFGSYYTTYLRGHLLVRSSKDGREQGRLRWLVELTDDRRTPNAFDLLPWTPISYLEAVANKAADEQGVPRTEPADQVGWLISNLDRSISLMSEPATWAAFDEFHHQYTQRYEAETDIRRTFRGDPSA